MLLNCGTIILVMLLVQPSVLVLFALSLSLSNMLYVKSVCILPLFNPVRVYMPRAAVCHLI